MLAGSVLGKALHPYNGRRNAETKVGVCIYIYVERESIVYIYISYYIYIHSVVYIYSI